MEQKDLPTYLLTYDHGGYILWGEHFKERLDSAIDWLEKYPSFKLGLDNESFAYDQYAETQPEIIAFVKEKLQAFAGRLAIGSSTYGLSLIHILRMKNRIKALMGARSREKADSGAVIIASQEVPSRLWRKAKEVSLLRENTFPP